MKASLRLLRRAAVQKRNWMSDYRAFTIGPDGHIFKAEAMQCEMMKQRSPGSGCLLQRIRLKSGAATASSSGSILRINIRRRCRRERPATCSKNLPVPIEGEDNANGLAFGI